jgi:uncharacterized protein (DUF1697 family)
MNNNYQYIAFLKGINVGGHLLIRMADLKNSFEEMGFEHVRTILASGNVIFESRQDDKQVLTQKIESALKSAWKKDIGVILRNMDDLRNLRSSGPFRRTRMTPDIRLYVTFLAHRAGPRSITLPYTSPGGEFGIIHATDGEVFSSIDLSKGKGTTDLMNLLTKEYGPDITTRNWNTVVKVLQ